MVLFTITMQTNNANKNVLFMLNRRMGIVARGDHCLILFGVRPDTHHEFLAPEISWFLLRASRAKVRLRGCD